MLTFASPMILFMAALKAETITEFIAGICGFLIGFIGGIAAWRWGCRP